MPEHDDTLTRLGDVGVTPPRVGDAGDERIWSALGREITPPRTLRRARWTPPRIRLVDRRLLGASALGAMAAVAAGIVVATGAFGGAGHSGSRVAFPAASRVGGVPTENVSYVVDHVTTRVAATAPDATIVHSDIYHGGDVSADGSIVDPGWRMQSTDDYTDAQGDQYSRDTLFQSDGSLEQTVYTSWAPDQSGDRGPDVQTGIDPSPHIYYRTSFSHSGNPNINPAPTSPAAVRAALQSGQVTEHGTTTVDGAQAIVLSMTAPNAPGSPATEVALYVDASTYQPLREVSYQQGSPDITVSDWESADSASIDQITHPSIPDGYTRTSQEAVNRATYRG